MYNKFLNKIAIRSGIYRSLLATSVFQKREIACLLAEIERLWDFKVSVGEAQAAYARAKFAEVPDA